MYKKAIVGLMIILAFGFSQTRYKEGRDGTRLSPSLLNYQGYLTDTVGIPITDTLGMTFLIYATSTGGSDLWHESQEVALDRGIFHVLLGSQNPIPDSIFTQGTDRWLEIAFDYDTLAPRTRIVSVSYAYTATYADTAEHARNAGADNDWVRGTPDSVLFTANYLGVARGGTDNELYGINVRSHVNFGVQCTTGASGANYSYATIAGGYRNAAAHNYTAIGGGVRNRATNSVATIAGGSNNEASGVYSTCGGGHQNICTNQYATIGGGYSNEVTGNFATCGGGYDNTCGNQLATIAGGYSNEVTSTSSYGTICGGYNNTVSGHYTTIAGGGWNSASAERAGILSGFNNEVSGNYGVAAGHADTVYALYGAALSGYSNVAGDTLTDTAAVVAGGYENRATDMYTTVGGGEDNSAMGPWATVGGGWSNEATDAWATISGGDHNTAGFMSTVGGGYQNTANGRGFIGGGVNNTIDSGYSAICGGRENEVQGHYGVVGGGYYNRVTAEYAVIAGGYHNRAAGERSFIGGGYYNYTGDEYAVVAGGEEDTSAGRYSFTTNRNSVVGAGWDYSAAFNGRATTAHSQIACHNLSVTGTKAFTIDHPLDPTGKILNHYCIESAEMMLIYRGTVIIGDDERVSVQLPDYFDALAKNPKIHLTGIGTYEVFVAQRVSGNQFVIGGKPGTEVDWLVTAERSDQSAEIGKIVMPVEQQKTGGLVGRSLDDDYLATTKEYLEKIGRASGFEFRTARGRQKYQRWTQD